jgi:carboxylesterase type B
VLLHGQSTGAMDTFTIATLPQAPSLISAAIMESGGGRDAPLYDSMQTLGQSYAQSLNCSVSDVSRYLSTAPSESLTSVFNRLLV